MVLAQEDTPARRVPDGTPLTIPQNTFVAITQALGGNYTVVYNGQMVRVDGTDADKLGLQAEKLSFPAPVDDQINPDQVWEALGTVFDPGRKAAARDLRREGLRREGQLVARAAGHGRHRHRRAGLHP